jgi:hypothetical protein
MQHEQHDARRATQWLHRIRAEYREMPGLNLTRAQMQRLWGLAPAVCNEMVDSLVAAQVLRQTPDGTYVAFASARRAD